MEQLSDNIQALRFLSQTRVDIDLRVHIGTER